MGNPHELGKSCFNNKESQNAAILKQMVQQLIAEAPGPCLPVATTG